MDEIIVVGIGPGPLKYLTREAEEELLKAEKVFLRLSNHPVCGWLRDQGKHVVCFDFAYGIPKLSFTDIYKLIVSTLIREARLRGHVVYSVPGNPSVFEATTRWLRKEAESGAIRIKLIPGMSFLDLIYSELGLDPGAGLQILTPKRHLSRSVFSKHLGLIVAQIMVRESPSDDIPDLGFVGRHLLREFPPDHPVTLIWTSCLPDYTTESRTLALGDLVQQLPEEPAFASLYVPPRTRK